MSARAGRLRPRPRCTRCWRRPVPSPAIDAFAATRESRLFYIHSRWVDQAAFEWHATLAHTVRFVEVMTPLIDHPFEATRARVVE
jgi:quinol monooxygenase YgiN